MPTFRNVAVVGVGLIGGSIGLALRERGLAGEVIGVGRRQVSLDKALSCGILDRATTDLAEGVRSAEIVVVATPVSSIIQDVCLAVGANSESALITDAGSTKATICAGVEQQLGNQAGRFVGSHPLAGDHRSGPEYARANLLDGKHVVVTPTEKTPSATMERVQEFWKSLGAEVIEMSPEQHDLALASTSHLPHLVASTLVGSTPDEWLELAATGWADTTRLAAGNPELWTQILSQNTPAVLAALDRFVAQLETVRTGLAAADWTQVTDFLEHAKRTRDALGN